MKKKQFQVKTYVIKAYCEKCGEELIEPDMLLTYPPQYKYKCHVCGKETIYGTKYPCIVYKTDGEGVDIE